MQSCLPKGMLVGSASEIMGIEDSARDRLVAELLRLQLSNTVLFTRSLACYCSKASEHLSELVYFIVHCND